MNHLYSSIDLILKNVLDFLKDLPGASSYAMRK